MQKVGWWWQWYRAEKRKNKRTGNSTKKKYCYYYSYYGCNYQLCYDHHQKVIIINIIILIIIIITTTASFPVGIKNSFPGVKAATHVNLLPRIMIGPTLLHPLYAFMTCAGTTRGLSLLSLYPRKQRVRICTLCETVSNTCSLFVNIHQPIKFQYSENVDCYTWCKQWAEITEVLLADGLTCRIIGKLLRKSGSKTYLAYQTEWIK